MADANTSEAVGKANPVPIQSGTNDSGGKTPLQSTNVGPKLGTGQPVSSGGKDQAGPQDDSIFWTVFWPALVLAIFVFLWKTGKVEAIKKHFNETREQLRKSTWPTREELKQHIVVVLLSSVLLAVFTVAADFVVREIIWGMMLQGDTVLFDKQK